jgi:hypothetical protein
MTLKPGSLLAVMLALSPFALLVVSCDSGVCQEASTAAGMSACDYAWSCEHGDFAVQCNELSGGYDCTCIENGVTREGCSSADFCSDTEDQQRLANKANSCCDFGVEPID